MLEITVKLVPYGDEKNARTLATLKIVNDGSGTGGLGNYVITAKVDELSRPGEPSDAEERWTEYVYRVEGWNRGSHATRLVEEALRKLHE
ncbi:MAG: hypothetical protein ACYC69_02680 [Thermodesulfovibrionales bacterium]